jgi:hypothetical protein
VRFFLLTNVFGDDQAKCKAFLVHVCFFERKIKTGPRGNEKAFLLKET